MSNLGKINHLSLELAELVKQLNNAMDIAHLGMYEWDTANNKVRFDKRAYEITGIDPNTFQHTMDAVLDEIVHPDSLEAFKESLMLAREKNIIPNRAYRLRHPYRKVCWIKFMSRIIREEGRVTKLIGVMMDVTDLRKAELTLRKISKAQKIMMDFNHQMIDYKEEKKFLHDIMTRFMLLLEKATTAGLMKIEEDGVIYLYDSHELSLKNKKLSMTYENSFLHLVVNGEYDRVHTVNELHIDLLGPDDVGREILDQNLVQSMVLIPITHLGKIRWFFVYGSDQLNGFSEEDIKITDFIRTEMDALIKMYLYFQQTLMMAHYDSVTGLMNRAYFDKRLQDHIQKHGNEKFYVVLIDLDGLKQINDVLGHDAGDRYLKLLGHLLLSHCASNSFWGRIGGDEYAGVVYGSNYQELVKNLENMQRMYRMKLYKESKEKFSLDFSYGISHYPKDGRAYKELLKAADKLMYAYKNTHKHKKGR